MCISCLAVTNVITSDVLAKFFSAELDFFWCYVVNHWSLPSDQKTSFCSAPELVEDLLTFFFAH